MKEQLNPTLVYILSILGFLCCCLGGLGFIPSGIAFFIAQSKLKLVKENPENYENIKSMDTAKIVALVVLIINLLMVIRIVYVISTIGWDELLEQSRDMMEQMQQNG
ncbi:MAG: hypothetical protein IMY67_10360 [Bacteroidetes bacterium]|nr:hypothetical protein [Bacteroidota bacterium]